MVIQMAYKLTTILSVADKLTVLTDVTPTFSCRRTGSVTTAFGSSQRRPMTTVVELRPA